MYLVSNLPCPILSFSIFCPQISTQCSSFYSQPSLSHSYSLPIKIGCTKPKYLHYWDSISMPLRTIFWLCPFLILSKRVQQLNCLCKHFARILLWRCWLSFCGYFKARVRQQVPKFMNFWRTFSSLWSMQIKLPFCRIFSFKIQLP